MPASTPPALRHRRHFSPETIQRLVIDSYERLDALAHIEGAPGGGPPRVLFVCSHNAGRSQMAAALLTHRAPGQVTVSSAGTHPAAGGEPVVAQVLTEAGVDLTDAFPEPPTDEVVQTADIVITELLDSLPST